MTKDVEIDEVIDVDQAPDHSEEEQRGSWDYIYESQFNRTALQEFPSYWRTGLRQVVVYP
jgi:hypothetical protein